MFAWFLNYICNNGVLGEVYRKVYRKTKWDGKSISVNKTINSDFVLVVYFCKYIPYVETVKSIYLCLYM